MQPHTRSRGATRPTSFPCYDWNPSDIAILKKVGEFHSDDRSKTAIAFQSP